MARDEGRGNRQRPLVIRKEEVTEGGHHGGAWKVAYADFVTAMMAFFLLMWLLNATTEEQRKGLADYFSPTAVLSHNSSGSGQPFSGHTAFDQGTLISDRGAVQVTVGKAPVIPDVEDDDSDTPAKPRPYRKETGKEQPDTETELAASAAAPPAAANQPADAKAAAQRGDQSGNQRGAQAGAQTSAETGAEMANPEAAQVRAPTEAELRAEQEARERAAFEQAAQQIREAVRADPALAELARQLAIDMTPEGLRIQILDEDRSPMFATGSSALNDKARALLQKVTPVLLRLPEPISIAGHTDAAPYKGQEKTNWELSAERANATRRLLMEAGLPETRVRSVTGNADRDPLLPADPMAAANRRIAIVVLRSASAPASPPTQAGP